MLEWLEYLITNYGYLALFLGTFAEGETILVLGGIAAATGHLQLQWVIVAAFCGSLLGDQTVFLIGRLLGKRILAWLALRRPWVQPRVDRVHRLMERHHVLLLLGFRFLYGLRNIIPLVVGSSGVKTSRFIFLNVIGAIVWAITVATGGYLFGTALEALLGHAKFIQLALIVAVAAVAAAIWVFRHIYMRYRARQAKKASGTFLEGDGDS